MGNYRHSNWVLFPGIGHQKEVPYKHAVEAHFIFESLELLIVNITQDGIRVGRLNACPMFLEIRDIIFELEFILNDQN